MTAQRIPRPLQWFLTLIVLGTSLRVWAGIRAPVLDVSDKGQLWAALGLGVVVALVVRYAARGRDLGMGNAPPFAARMVVALMGFSLGALLGSGLYLAGNAVLDGSAVKWTSFTVEGHPRGRNGSQLDLREYSADGQVHEVWVADTRETARLSIGDRVEVPVRPGAFGTAWIDGEVRKAP